MFSNRTLVIALLLAAGCGDSGSGDDQAVDAPTSTAMAVVPLTSPDGSFYSASLMINGVGYGLDIDTGSSSIGIAGSTCTGCPVHPLYAPTADATDTHLTASTMYADGSGWSGEIFTDKVTLGAATPTVPVSFVSINQQMGGFFADNSYQGILGLGPTELLETGTTSYIDAIKSAGASDAMAFEFCDAGGTMWLGGFDSSKFSGAMQYTAMLPITSQNPFYAVSIADMGLGGTSLGFGASVFQNPIVDTGTSLFYIPTSVDHALLAAVNASAGFKALFPSATLSDTSCAQGASTVTTAMVDAMLPELSMAFAGQSGGANFTVSAKASRTYLYDAGGGMFCFAFADGGEGQNYFGVMGDTIMRAFVTVVDPTNLRVGFAPDAGCATTSHARIARAAGPLHEHGHPPRRAH